MSRQERGGKASLSAGGGHRGPFFLHSTQARISGWLAERSKKIEDPSLEFVLQIKYRKRIRSCYRGSPQVLAESTLQSLRTSRPPTRAHVFLSTRLEPRGWHPSPCVQPPPRAALRLVEPPVGTVTSSATASHGQTPRVLASARFLLPGGRRRPHTPKGGAAFAWRPVVQDQAAPTPPTADSPTHQRAQPPPVPT